MISSVIKVINSCYEEERIKIWIFFLISIGLSLTIVGIIPLLSVIFSILALHRTLDFNIVHSNRKLIKRMCVVSSLLPVLLLCLFFVGEYNKYNSDKAHVEKIISMKNMLKAAQKKYDDLDRDFSLSNQKSFKKTYAELSLSLKYIDFLLESIDSFPNLVTSNGRSCLKNREHTSHLLYAPNEKELAFAQKYFNENYKGCYSSNELKSVVIPELSARITLLENNVLFNIYQEVESFKNELSILERSRYLRKDEVDDFHSYVEFYDEQVALLILSFVPFVYYFLYCYLYCYPIIKSQDSITCFLSEREQVKSKSGTINIIKGERLKSYSVAEELTKWHALNKQGVISDKEYQEVKDKLLK